MPATGTAAWLPHHRPDLEHLRPAGDDDPGRPGRGRDQGGEPARRRPHARLGEPARRVFRVLPQQQPQQALDRAGPEDRRGARGGIEAGRHRRRVRAEFPARRRRAHGPGRGRRARGGAEDRLCLDQRFWRERAVRREAGVRSGGAGAVQPRNDPGGIGHRTAAPGAHHPAGQADRRYCVAGNNGGAAGARAHRRGAACAAVHAGCGAGVPVELRHGRPDLRR